MKYPQTFPFYFSERWDELSVLAAVLPMRSDIKILIAALAGVWDRNMVLTLPPPTPAIHISDQGFFHQTDHRRARYQTFILYGEGGRHTMRSKLHTMRTERVKQPVSYFLRLWKWMIGGGAACLGEVCVIIPVCCLLYGEWSQLSDLHTKCLLALQAVQGIWGPPPLWRRLVTNWLSWLAIFTNCIPTLSLSFGPF